MSSIVDLKDDFLIESYLKAVELELDPLFIEMLKKEIDRRNINLEEK